MSPKSSALRGIRSSQPGLTCRSCLSVTLVRKSAVVQRSGCTNPRSLKYFAASSACPKYAHRPPSMSRTLSKQSYKDSPAWYSATTVEMWAMFVRERSELTYSSAVLASSPRVELSQAWILAFVIIASAMDTRFFSPPLTPRTYSLPTFVSRVCSIQNSLTTDLRKLATYSFAVSPSFLLSFPGVFVFSANFNVFFTDSVA